MVYFVRLGFNVVRVWVDVVKVYDVEVWRKLDEIEFVKDVYGSLIVWLIDKLFIF